MYYTFISSRSDSDYLIPITLTTAIPVVLSYIYTKIIVMTFEDILGFSVLLLVYLCSAEI